MATFKICVFEHQRRQDGKYPVSIRVYWKGKSSYIGTEYYVTDKQISKKKYLNRKGEKKEAFILKDIYIINELNDRIKKYEDLKSQKLGLRIEQYTARELAKFFSDETRPGTDSTINFVEFARRCANKAVSERRKSAASNMNRVTNAMIDFCNGRDNIPITEITAKFLVEFEAFLRSERTISRKNQFGRMVTTKKKGISDVSVFDYMTDLRTLFNDAIDEYNDEDRGLVRITHYPFRKYKLNRRPENVKRNITVEQLAAIRDVPEEDLLLTRPKFARDVFMLSFYLVGINLADLYEVRDYTNGRLTYEREKTSGRRVDRALISINVEPEAMGLMERYRDSTGARVFDFYTRYSTAHTFSSNVDMGLKIVAGCVGIPDIPLTTYYARHSWATIARNKCGISKDDIDLSLNHVDQGSKMADTYIEKDWSLIDRANRAVLDLLKKV